MLLLSLAGGAVASDARSEKTNPPALHVSAGIVAASALDATASRLSVPPDQHIQTAHLLQPKEAEEANKSPGFKVQKLMTALWNLDRLDQRVLPLDQRFVYGSPQSPGTGGAQVRASSPSAANIFVQTGSVMGCARSLHCESWSY